MSLKRRLLPAALLASLTVPFVALGTLPAQAADDQITGYAAEATLTGDGVLKVKETVDLTAGGDTFKRTLTTRVRSDAEQRPHVRHPQRLGDGERPARRELRRTPRSRTAASSASRCPGSPRSSTATNVDNVVADSVEGREVSWPVVQGYNASDPEGDADGQRPVRHLGDLLRRPGRLEHALYFVAAGRVGRAGDRSRTASRPADG